MRVADVRVTQVTEARIRAFLFTWGGGRVTSEGEAIPVRVERLPLGAVDSIILPHDLEHTIGEAGALHVWRVAAQPPVAR